MYSFKYFFHTYIMRDYFKLFCVDIAYYHMDTFNAILGQIGLNISQHSKLSWTIRDTCHTRYIKLQMKTLVFSTSNSMKLYDEAYSPMAIRDFLITIMIIKEWSFRWSTCSIRTSNAVYCLYSTLRKLHDTHFNPLIYNSVTLHNVQRNKI